MSMIIAKNMGYSQDDIYNIGLAGLLHDIGKSKVPLEILNKPAKLNDEEFAVMKKHTIFGYEIIKEKENFSKTIALAVLQHHEKLKAKGLSQRTSIEMIMSMTEELDMKAMKTFFKTVILYPVDSTVELSNGEKARVVGNNDGSVLRPTVVSTSTGKV